MSTAMGDLPERAEDVTLLDLLDRLVDQGVVLMGDLVVSVAGVDLLYVGLRVIIASVSRLDRARLVGSGRAGEL